jgi:hypothetical protein
MRPINDFIKFCSALLHKRENEKNKNKPSGIRKVTRQSATIPLQQQYIEKRPALRW